MKKKKLNLEKFRIAELKNSNKIFGGTGDDGPPYTEEKKKKLKCILTSEVIIEEPIIIIGEGN